jgi:ABC-2 type transport system ATP-binding protein
MTWALETTGLTKVFNRETAVDDCSLQVPEGSVFGLMGPNGAGKTTLIKMLMGALLPTAGSGRMLGRDISDPTGEVRQEIGYVADTQQMYPHFKVEEILKFCSMVYRSWDEQRCRTLLKSFGLPQEKQVRSLSKGMKTQLGLIIALSVRPRLLILDEPASGLDPVLHHHFMQLLMQETAREGTTVFFATHNLYDLERTAEQVAVIMKGKILFSKPLDELKSSSRKIQVVFPEGIPEQARKIPGVLRVEEQGRVSW